MTPRPQVGGTGQTSPPQLEFSGTFKMHGSYPALTAVPERLWFNVKKQTNLKHQQALLCGSAEGAAFQAANDLGKMKSEDREQLLRDAGLRGTIAAPGTALALKADLHLPWFQLRKLHKRLVSFGIELESERVVRASISALPKYHAEDIPMVTRTGSVEMTTYVYIPDLVSYILYMLNERDSHNTLVWHPGMPEEEVWVKLGGDHGGGSKLQILFPAC